SRVCSSVNVGTTAAGINMDAVLALGEVLKETAERTKEHDGFGCAKLVIFANAPTDNPFMAGGSDRGGGPDSVGSIRAGEPGGGRAGGRQGGGGGSAGEPAAGDAGGDCGGNQEHGVSRDAGRRADRPRSGGAPGGGVRDRGPVAGAHAASGGQRRRDPPGD